MLKKLTVIAVLFMGCASSQAATVYLDPIAQSASIGSSVAVSLAGEDFSQTIDGGGINLSFNPAVLQITNVTVNTTTWEFSTTPGTINNTTGDLTNLTFSSLFGRSGNFPIAQIDFLATGFGNKPVNPD